jgi:hypothetical protein
MTTNDNNILENVKHIHPPISDTYNRTERSSGLDDAACCASDFIVGLSFECKKSLWKKLTHELATRHREETINDETPPYGEYSLFNMSRLFSILCDGGYDELYSRFNKVFEGEIPEC